MIVAWLVGMAVGFVAAGGFCAQYALGTPRWYRDPAGRVLMILTLALFGLLGLSLLAAAAIRAPAWLFLGGMYTLDAALLGLWWLLRREQRHSKVKKIGDQQ